MKKFSQELQDWRAMNGLTQSQAALFLEISLRTLQGYEWEDRECPSSKEVAYRSKMAIYSLRQKTKKQAEQAQEGFVGEPKEGYVLGRKEQDDFIKEIEFLKGIIENQRQTIAHLLLQSKTQSK